MSRVWPRGSIHDGSWAGDEDSWLLPHQKLRREMLEKADIAFIDSLSFKERQELGRCRGVATSERRGEAPGDEDG